MLVTLATFHFEMSELKTLALSNTAEVPKERERENRKRNKSFLISDKNKNWRKERGRRKKTQVVERELKRGN